MMNQPLLGYIDPSSGFIILQGIIAAIVGSAVFFRQMIWQAIGFVLGRGKSAEAAAGQSASVDPGKVGGAPVVNQVEPTLAEEKVRS